MHEVGVGLRASVEFFVSSFALFVLTLLTYYLTYLWMDLVGPSLCSPLNLCS